MTDMMEFGLKIMFAMFALSIPLATVLLLGWLFGGNLKTVLITAGSVEAFFIVVCVAMFRE